MTTDCRFKHARSLVLSIVLFFSCTFLSSAADTLSWDEKGNRVDADIQSWSLQTLLEKLSDAAGWEIYVEPETKLNVSVKFSYLKLQEALPRLLGKLNYALLPQTNGPPRFYVFETTVGEATKRIGATDKKAQSDKPPTEHLIRNQLVVTLDPASGMTIEELAKQLGAKIVGRADGLNTYLLEFENEALANAAREKLKSDKSVASIDSNYRFDPPEDSNSLPLSSSPAFKIKAVGSSEHLIVAVIDSAMQTLDPAMQAFVLKQLSVAGPAAGGDTLSHGTSVAQVLLQALNISESASGTSKVRILPVDVYGVRPTTTTYDVANGIYTAVNNGAMVVNLSLGSSGDSEFLRRIILDSSKQGVLFFASAGNEPTTAPTFPAAYPEVIAVTAGDRQGQLASYANRGDFVDLIGPGGAVVQHNGQSYLVGGTSIASPYITGIAVGKVDETGKSFTEIVNLLRQNFAFQR